MQRVANAPKDRKPNGGEPDKYIPLSQTEIQIMTTTNLVDYMTRHGAKQHGKPRQVKDKSRNSSGGTALEYNLSFGKGMGAVVYHKANGTWGFFMRDGTEGRHPQFRHVARRRRLQERLPEAARRSSTRSANATRRPPSSRARSK